MHTQEISLEKLLLDPNNYRLQEISGYASVSDDKFHLENVQRTTLQRLQKEGIKELRASIVANGFLPIERIVVTPYLAAEGQFLVIEGNRRVAALKSIKDQSDAGIDFPDGVLATLSAIPCIVANDDDQSFPHFKETLMGIRHVGGIRKWGGYQQAKLIADLRDKHRVDAGDVSDRLGLSVLEVNRRYRAFKALQQMERDEGYSDDASPALYPIFHEAVAVPAIREWLGWNQSAMKFDNEEQLENFYKLITPTSDGETSDQKSPKLASYSDVRELKSILGNAEAKAYLLDPEKTLSQALSITRKDEMIKRWRGEIAEAKTALEKVGALEVANFSDEDIAAISSLIKVATQLLEFNKSTKKE